MTGSNALDAIARAYLDGFAAGHAQQSEQVEQDAVFVVLREGAKADGVKIW